MTRILFVVVVTVWLSSASAASSLYFDFSDVSVKVDEQLELACGVEGHFRHCFWETERGDVFQVEDVHAGLHPNMRASSNLTHNQCGIVVDALTERNFGKWTCRVYFAGSTLRAERTIGKALSCPEPFTQVGTDCYYIHHESDYTWEEARNVCQGLDPNGDLAVLNDCHQFQLVWNKILVDYPTSWYWIGGSDRYQEGSWHWVSGEPVAMGTPFWRPDEPQADGGCLNLSTPYGYFNDYSCSQKSYFICQILY
ncbi:C-type lectin domain family 17, member A [Chionoecetes opilio]|uniref:C-type lectin domain family 17, member A n=1 Tax=Chionoecetes opilio TaxID=41210 RepID=A0A8J5CHI0_CHIOP|nr:C-type lectin domain family 17, member A [Chionoecetes opilio]